MKIKELIGKVSEALHRAVRGERPPRPIVFDSITDLSKALVRAKDAHSEFERGLGTKDYNWPLWYAAYITMEQGSAEKSASKIISSRIEASSGSENAPCA
jgi:hypothetical protein